MNVTASQIRQDLNNFGGFGQQGYGYNVQYLYDEIGKLLGLDVKHKMIIVGAGNLGQAIANYGNFRNRGFEIAALFDKNPDLIGKKTAHGQILDIADIYDYVKKHNVEIVALTLPKGPAKKDSTKACRVWSKGFLELCTYRFKFFRRYYSRKCSLIRKFNEAYI